MPKFLIICMSVFLITQATGALADDKLEMTGDVTLGGIFLKENGNSSKFTEYQDINDGMIGNFRFDATKGTYYMSLIGENVGFAKNHVISTDDYHIGRDNQFYMLKGGKYDMFKFSLFYNETPHNLMFGARTFYAGVGSNSLVFLRNATPTINSYFNIFDYKVDRRDYGASMEFSFKTPFYLSIYLSENDKKGVQPFSAATSSPGGGFVEFPMPVNYKTRNMFLEAGYRTKDLIFAIDGTISGFENNNDYLYWRIPYSRFGVQASSLPPDNDYWRIGGKVHLRLPWESTLTLKGSYANLENNLNMLSSYINVPGVSASSNIFNGNYVYTTVSADFTTHPVKPLDIRLFYNYLNKDNNSSTILFVDRATGTTSTNDRFWYNKQTAGLDVGYKLPLKTKINVGYEYLRMNRSQVVRPDAVFTNDNKVYLQVKNSYFDFLTAKVKYEHLSRRSDFQNATAQTLPTDPDDGDFILRFVRPFDYADKTQDTLKVGFELTPIDNLQVGIEYIYKQNDYDQTIIGRTSDDRHEVYVDAGYTWPGKCKISGYFDYENVTTESRHRNFTTGTPADPFAPPTTAAYNWKANLNDHNYAYGVGVEVPVLKDKLDLVASWGYEKANGNAGFASQNNVVALYNIGNFDDYSKKAVNVKMIYKFNKHLNITAGYAYEKYRYNDAATDGYLFVVPAANPVSNNYLTGAYIDQNYEANIWFLTATYKF